MDDVPWRDELFTHKPNIQDGKMIISNDPGWGTAVNEDVAKKYSWNK